MVHAIHKRLVANTAYGVELMTAYTFFISNRFISI